MHFIVYIYISWYLYMYVYFMVNSEKPLALHYGCVF